MLSETQYRERLDMVFIGTGSTWAQGGADWNNQMLLALAINGLMLLPFPHPHASPPFRHYNEMPVPSPEPGNQQAWVRSWIVDADWEDHYKPPLKFAFTPLTKG